MPAEFTSNHPITINLAPTNITEVAKWNTIDSSGTTYSVDGYYPSDRLRQIPNIMQDIKSVADSENTNPAIGESNENEINGNDYSLEGGAYISSETSRDYTLDSTLISATNRFNITSQAQEFMGLARVNGGVTMNLFLHGRSDTSLEFAELNYVQGPDTGTDGSEFNVEFYKYSSYIAFKSKEASVPTLTTNQISFRKSPHHIYVSLTSNEMQGISTSNQLGGLLQIDLSTPIDPSKETKLTQMVSGRSTTFNQITATESTSAGNDAATPTVITCVNRGATFTSFSSNSLKFDNNASSSIFTGASNYNHNGKIGTVVLPISGYNIPAGQVLAIRTSNPVTAGSRNYLALSVADSTSKRLFGGTNSMEFSVGSYVEISGSASNNGIYQVISVQDGIDGDTAFNTLIGGSTKYQYLELSRPIVPEDSSVGTNITIRNVSTLPVLHLKYCVKN